MTDYNMVRVLVKKFAAVLVALVLSLVVPGVIVLLITQGVEFTVDEYRLVLEATWNILIFVSAIYAFVFPAHVFAPFRKLVQKSENVKGIQND